MGIKNLMKIIQQYAPNSIKYTKIQDYSNKKLAIDANLMLYKIIYAVRIKGYDIKNDNMVVTHIHLLLQKLLNFIKYKIYAVFVFDGVAPHIKKETLKNRKIFQNYMKLKYNTAITQDEKKKYYYMKSDITFEEIEDCKELIRIFGFPIIESIEEADSQLAYMSKKKLVYGIVTDDMDILIFGGKKILKNFSVSDKKNIQEINLDILLKKLNINQFQLIDLGILLGCDYCPTVKGIGTIKSYKIIKEYNNLDNLTKNNIITLSVNYKKAQNYFIHPSVKSVSTEELINKKINIGKLKIFLKRFNFKKKYIKDIYLKLNIHTY